MHTPSLGSYIIIASILNYISRILTQRNARSLVLPVTQELQTTANNTKRGAVCMQFPLNCVVSCTHSYKILSSHQNMWACVSYLCAARGPETILCRTFKQDYLFMQAALQGRALSSNHNLVLIAWKEFLAFQARGNNVITTNYVPKGTLRSSVRKLRLCSRN